MNLFDQSIRDVMAMIEKSGDAAKIFPFDSDDSWPGGRKGQLILRQDTAVEFGNPAFDSVSIILWTSDLPLISENRVIIQGPDISEAEGNMLPLGKVVMIYGKGFDEENSYDRYRMMEAARYDVSLEGYMMKTVPQYMREWIRVSKQAVDRGFSLRIPAGRLIERLLSHDFVEKASVLMITEPGESMELLKRTGIQTARYIGAMARMTEEMDFDCSTCGYQDVCSGASDLRLMREKLKEKWDG